MVGDELSLLLFLVSDVVLPESPDILEEGPVLQINCHNQQSFIYFCIIISNENTGESFLLEDESNLEEILDEKGTHSGHPVLNCLEFLDCFELHISALFIRSQLLEIFIQISTIFRNR